MEDLSEQVAMRRKESNEGYGWSLYVLEYRCFLSNLRHQPSASTEALRPHLVRLNLITPL